VAFRRAGLDLKFMVYGFSLANSV